MNSESLTAEPKDNQESSEAVLEQKPLSQLFSGGEWTVFALLILAGLVLRWLLLDLRPVHHDESLHIMYGYYFFDHPESLYYKYQPMLHGPVLYHLLPLFYNTFGVSEWAARLPMTMIGTLFMFIPLFFRRFFSAKAVLVLTAVIALSPTLVYWSRFLRHDFLVMSWWLLIAFGALLAPPKFKPLCILLGVTLQFCTKENAYVTAAVVSGYLLFEVLFACVRVVLEKNLNFLVSAISKPAGYRLILIPLACLLAFVGFWIAGPSIAKIPPISYLFIAILVIYFVCELSFILFAADGTPTLLHSLLSSIRRYPAPFALACAVSFLVYYYFFSAGFRHFGQGELWSFERWFGVIYDAVYRESIAYWVKHHNMERIKGPFLFHFYMLSYYESMFVLAFIAQIALLFKMAGKRIRMALLAVVGVALLAALFHFSFINATEGVARLLPQSELNEDGRKLMESTASGMFYYRIWAFFKLDDLLDLLGLIVFLFCAPIVTIFHLHRNERGLAFWGYFFTATLFTYSYLGEKVPWLSMYPLITGLFYFALFFDSYFKNHPVAWAEKASVWKTMLVIGIVATGLGVFFSIEKGSSFAQNWRFIVAGLVIVILAAVGGQLKMLGRYNAARALFVLLVFYNFRAAILTNFVHGGESSEYISQVHTTFEFDAIARRIRNEIKDVTHGRDIKVLTEGEAVWPMTSYMVGMKQFKFSAPPSEKPSFQYLLQSWNDGKKEGFPEGFHAQKITLRGWWVPDYNKVTLKRFLNYALNHTPWNPPGYSYAWFLTKKE